MHSIGLDVINRCNLNRYRPQWTNAQAIRYIVDEFESGRATNSGFKLGLKLGS